MSKVPTEWYQYESLKVNPILVLQWYVSTGVDDKAGTEYNLWEQNIEHM